MQQSRSYDALNETHRQVEELHTRLEPEARQPRNYETLRETQQQVEETRATEEQQPERPVLRSWTHLGGMVPQQGSAIRWDKQNQEIIRMSDRGDTGNGRNEQGPSSPQRSGNENDPGLQEARAAVEEARRREAAERARQQERDRGPER